MAEEIKTSFNGKDGNGGLTLYANPFDTGKKFYGRFERDVLSMENLLSRVQQKNPGTDEIIINTGISYIKREILAALKEGKAALHLRPAGGRGLCGLRRALPRFLRAGRSGRRHHPAVTKDRAPVRRLSVSHRWSPDFLPFFPEIYIDVYVMKCYN